MTGSGIDARVTQARDSIATAFADRPTPLALTDSKQLSDLEYEEVMSFDGMHWRDITFAHIEQYPDTVFWFSPEAFCSYLPGILLAGLKENRRDSNAYDALIGMLDRSPEPAYWDDFFLPRWRRLSDPEIEAVKSWVRWLKSVQPDAFQSNTFERVHETLTLLQAFHD